MGLHAMLTPIRRFRLETEDHAFQGVLDSLLSTATFIFIGTIMPFHGLPPDFAVWRLVVLIIIILIFKRLPVVLAFQKVIPAFEDRKQAIFSGWVSHATYTACSSFILTANLGAQFGPIGVAAVYYLMTLHKEAPAERTRLLEVADPVVRSLSLTCTRILV
jgi:NhaP-type Na+/H+ or K+/H+ antiporter